MSIVKNRHGYWDLVCDINGEEAGEGFETWDDAVDYAKDNGWAREHAEDGWQNICPECREGE